MRAGKKWRHGRPPGCWPRISHNYLLRMHVVLERRRPTKPSEGAKNRRQLVNDRTNHVRAADRGHRRIVPRVFFVSGSCRASVGKRAVRRAGAQS